MKRQHRLTHRRQFSELRRRRISATSGCLRVQAAPNGGLPMRAGFAITGLRKAVQRNLIRRRLRSLLQPRLTELFGLDLLIAAGAPAAAASYAEMGTALTESLNKVVPRAQAFSRSTRRALAPVAENMQHPSAQGAPTAPAS